jgi:3-phosphoshikimate 1-carboxyvinyltransferase
MSAGEREIRVPGDKSISHRALMFSALAAGTSRITSILDSADVRSTASVLRTLGVGVPPLAPQMTVVGAGLRGLRAPVADLDCGNSGTTARLMAGVVAGHRMSGRFVGDESLSRRPMRRIARPLEAMGARLRFERSDGLPMWVDGGELHAIDWRTETASAQVKSAILLAALVAGVPVTVCEPALSRDHTERMLAARGITLRVDHTGIHLSPTASLPPADIQVPGDPSSAAYFVALAVCGGSGPVRLPNLCLNETRIGFLRVVQRMAAAVEISEQREDGGEPVGVVSARRSPLCAVQVTGAEVPTMIDELPLLACVATRAEGLTEITGAAELRTKESDRIRECVANLRSLGAIVEELPDGLAVRGSGAPLRGRVRTHGDHRLAMSFGVLARMPGNDVVVDDPSCVDVSYPAFWRHLAEARA